MLKRGHYVVIGGVALFVIGTAVTEVWELPITNWLKRHENLKWLSLIRYKVEAQKATVDKANTR